MNKNLQVLKYLLADYFAALIAWGLFFIYRKITVEPSLLDHMSEVLLDPKFYLGIVLVPFYWLLLYALTGTYSHIFRKSRLKELGQTMLITLIGVTFLFFVLILDDVIINYRSYYVLFIVLYALHFLLTYALRLRLTTTLVHKIHNKIIGFKTIIVGSNGRANSIYHDIENQEIASGNIFVGFVDVVPVNSYALEAYIPHLGNYKDLKQIILDHDVEEVIIAIEPSEHRTVENIITSLEDTSVVIKIIPDMKDILLGSVKMTSMFHAPLILISPDLIPPWQQSLKRIMDIVISLLALVLLSPVYLFTAIGVRMSSKGPIFYSHERVGLRGKPFMMHKFRSMFADSEKHGPELSSKDDPRITHFGKFLRKVRLDEIPQFYNVLKGDMSLVGPRPERQYFIDRIVQRAPHYRILHKVKPGMTSWGQVKYGYAENVDEMIERLQFDLLYIENMSILVDIKILIYTALIVVQGRGK